MYTATCAMLYFPVGDQTKLTLEQQRGLVAMVSSLESNSFPNLPTYHQKLGAALRLQVVLERNAFAQELNRRAMAGYHAVARTQYSHVLHIKCSKLKITVRF